MFTPTGAAPDVLDHRCFDQPSKSLGQCDCVLEPSRGTWTCAWTHALLLHWCEPTLSLSGIREANASESAICGTSRRCRSEQRHIAYTDRSHSRLFVPTRPVIRLSGQGPSSSTVSSSSGRTDAVDVKKCATDSCWYCQKRSRIDTVFADDGEYETRLRVLCSREKTFVHPHLGRLYLGADDEVAEDIVHSRSLAQCPLRRQARHSVLQFLPSSSLVFQGQVCWDKRALAFRPTFAPTSNERKYLLWVHWRDRRPMCKRGGRRGDCV